MEADIEHLRLELLTISTQNNELLDFHIAQTKQVHDLLELNIKLESLILESKQGACTRPAPTWFATPAPTCTGGRGCLRAGKRPLPASAASLRPEATS